MRGYDSGDVLREGLLRRIYEEISEIQRRMEDGGEGEASRVLAAWIVLQRLIIRKESSSWQERK
jgi:hypothetical protein